MVSSGTVTNDATTLEQYLKSYKTEMSGLEGSWKGPSHDSINSQADSFVSEYTGIVTQMNNFAKACDEYKEYIKLKSTTAQTESDRANASSAAKASYDSPLAQMITDLKKKKKNINTHQDLVQMLQIIKHLLNLYYLKKEIQLEIIQDSMMDNGVLISYQKC